MSQLADSFVAFMTATLAVGVPFLPLVCLERPICAGLGRRVSEGGDTVVEQEELLAWLRGCVLLGVPVGVVSALPKNSLSERCPWLWHGSSGPGFGASPILLAHR